jgi:hypothetical protein
MPMPLTLHPYIFSSGKSIIKFYHLLLNPCVPGLMAGFLVGGLK